MKLTHHTNVPLQEVNMDGAEGAKIRVLIGEQESAPNFATRLFEIEEGGHTPYHSHAWEHHNFVVEGQGVLVTEEGELPFKAGDVIYVDPYMKHRYKNTSDSVLKFLCIIPHENPIVPKKDVNPFAAGSATNC